MKPIYRTGYIAGWLAFSATLAYCIVQALQLTGVFSYPWDEVLIYGTSLCICLPFVLAVLALHYTTPPGKRYWTHASLLFATVYLVFVCSNYVVQLATVIPMTLQGKSEDLVVLRQSPHSMFWDYDAIGYFFMGLSLLFATAALEKTGFSRKVRLVFFANGLSTILSMIVYFYPGFSTGLLMLGIPWAITAPSALACLALLFKTNGN